MNISSFPYRSNLPALRRQAGLTQAQLAKRVGRNRYTVIKIEKGRRMSPPLKAKFAQALGVSPELIIQQSPQPAEQCLPPSFDVMPLAHILSDMGIHELPLQEFLRIAELVARQQVEHRDPLPNQAIVMIAKYGLEGRSS